MGFRRLNNGIIVKVMIGILLNITIESVIFPIWGQDPKPKTGVLDQEISQILTGQNPVPQAALVVSAPDSASPTFLFDWGEKNPALAVVKGSVTKDQGKWWIVFEEGATITLPDIKEHPRPGIKSIEILPTKDAVVLQVIVDSETVPFVGQDGNKWQVVFKSERPSISQKAVIQLPQAKEAGLSVGLEAPGKEVRFVDPHTGYTTVVFPSHQVGFGVEHEQFFPEFRIMASTQGVGFQLLKDDMNVQTASGRVTLNHPDGLAISLPHERDQVRKIPEPIGFFVDAQDIDWVSRREQINEALLDLSHDQHGPGELEMAWLLLSHGQSAEAMGYLTHLAQERPSIIDVPLFQILRGMGNLLLNRLPESRAYLLQLEEEPEIQIWLSLIQALQQPQYFASSPTSLAQIRSQFQRAKEILKSYPKPLRSQLVTLILMAGIAMKDVETLTAFLDHEPRPENISAGEVYDLARARVLLSKNKPDAALQILGELMEKASSPQVRAIARFDYVTHRLETKIMTKNVALPQLEGLRAQWHGGWFDREVGTYLEGLKIGKSQTTKP